MTESHLRSVIKGISWRIVGTIDTIIIAFFWTGDYSKALKIGFTEVFTKIFLYYLHERVWLYFLKGKSQSSAVSFTKAVTWRVVGTIDTMMLAWFFTGDAISGLKIGFTEVATKVLLYYLHERVWHLVPIGSVRKWFGLKGDGQSSSATTNTLPDTKIKSPATATDNAAL